MAVKDKETETSSLDERSKALKLAIEKIENCDIFLLYDNIAFFFKPCYNNYVNNVTCIV